MFLQSDEYTYYDLPGDSFERYRFYTSFLTPMNDHSDAMIKNLSPKIEDVLTSPSAHP